jgi:8-oxo-dGTP diphosphatase
MTSKGTSIIFINSREEILLLLRDDIPSIAYPNMWDIPGGRVEPGETPWVCIIREMKEEMDLDLTGHRLFRVTEFADRIEFTFWKSQEIDIHNLHLMEGQALRWFSREEAENTPLAFNFNDTVTAFFREAPFKER